MKKLYIFDLDGTLVNSVFDLGDSMNEVLLRHGFPTFDYDAYKRFVGNGTLKLVERALPEERRTKEKIAEYHEEFSEEYSRRCICKTRPYEGIEKVVETLRSRGILTAVASNKPDGFARFIVSSVFGEGKFDHIAGKKDGVPTKPAPEIIYNILEALNASAEECVVVGDSDVDVLTSRNAGAECIGCCWGFRGREELENAGADFIAEKPLDILDFKG